MRSVLLASLRTHTRRYLAAAIAVIVSVAFVVVIGVLTAGARAGILDRDGAPYRGADFVVDAAPGEPSRGPPCCPGTLNTRAALELVERLGDRASGLGRVLLQARGLRRIGSRDARGEVTVGPVAASEALRWQKLVAGRFPARLGEAVVHIWDARDWELAVGDRIRVGEGATAAELEVVGLVESPSTWTQASMYVTWPQYLQWREHPLFHVGSIAVRGDVGPVPEGMAMQPAEDYVRESLARLNHETDAFALLLLLFASVALFVSILVVANTFSILFAQRVGDFALLRCVGATRRQLVSSVRREAAVVGGGAALVGAVVGVALGYALISAINVLAPRTPMGAPTLPVRWLVGGFAVGLGATVVASWLPTRRVAAVSPLAALRSEIAGDGHPAASRGQRALAAILLITGLVLLGIAMIQGHTRVLVAGGGSVFSAVLLFGPVLIPRLVRVTGALLGPAGRLATANAVRNPRRTATTVAALLVGVTLTTAMLTEMATWRTAMDVHRDTRLPIDVALTSRDEPGLLDRVRRTPGVAQAIAVDGVVARIPGWDAAIPIVAAPAASQVARDGGAFAQVEPGTIRLDREAFRGPHKELGLQPGDRITVRAGDRHVELRVILLGGWGQAGVVAPDTLARLTDDPEPQVIWIRTARGADPIQLVGDLHRLADAAGATVEDHLQARAAGDRQLEVLTWSALGLLGISVAIALIGIANTLGLSVLERGPEHALLRALGLTRRQLRRMLAAEAMLMSIVASLLGATIGVGFAWAGYETFVTRVLPHATMQIPWPSLGGVVLLAGLAGLLASVLVTVRRTSAEARTRPLLARLSRGGERAQTGAVVGGAAR